MHLGTAAPQIFWIFCAPSHTVTVAAHVCPMRNPPCRSYAPSNRPPPRGQTRDIIVGCSAPPAPLPRVLAGLLVQALHDPPPRRVPRGPDPPVSPVPGAHPGSQPRISPPKVPHILKLGWWCCRPRRGSRRRCAGQPQRRRPPRHTARCSGASSVASLRRRPQRGVWRPCACCSCHCWRGDATGGRCTTRAGP